MQRQNGRLPRCARWICFPGHPPMAVASMSHNFTRSSILCINVFDTLRGCSCCFESKRRCPPMRPPTVRGVRPPGVRHPILSNFRNRQLNAGKCSHAGVSSHVATQNSQGPISSALDYRITLCILLCTSIDSDSTRTALASLITSALDSGRQLRPAGFKADLHAAYIYLVWLAPTWGN
jgi:hypothetical protein